MKKFFRNCKVSYKHIPYTFKHYIAFLRTEKKLTGKITHWHHDWDKLAMFLFLPWFGERISEIHRKRQDHHPDYTVLDSNGVWGDRHRKNPDTVDWEQAIIDWECARITKHDKPLDAYDTMKKYYPWTEEYTLPILKRLGLAHSEQ